MNDRCFFPLNGSIPGSGVFTEDNLRSKKVISDVTVKLTSSAFSKLKVHATLFHESADWRLKCQITNDSLRKYKFSLLGVWFNNIQVIYIQGIVCKSKNIILKKLHLRHQWRWKSIHGAMPLRCTIAKWLKSHLFNTKSQLYKTQITDCQSLASHRSELVA